MSQAPLGWLGIVRLGLVQTALGAVVVLTTSTLNRVMVVEWMLPAMLPGLLVGLHHAVQVLRPRWGHGSDVGGRRTPWIVGGMATLASGGFLAAVATAWMGTAPLAGIALSVVAFLGVGLGAGAAGTTLLVLLADRVAPARRAPAATICWVMMILGFIVTAGVVGQLLDPFSPPRLVAISAGVSLAAFLLTVLAVAGVEGRPAYGIADAAAGGTSTRFRAALAEVWAEPEARLFALFVFVSMLAYSAQDLILEPFAGLVFGLTPGQTTSLSSLQYQGVLIGMVVVGVLGSRAGNRRGSWMRGWTIAGCLASAAALGGLVVGAFSPDWPLRANVFLLGAANGAFAVAAIASMMGLVATGRQGRAGIRMGLWGAAQAIAVGFGGFLGTAAVDLCRLLVARVDVAYALVFAGEALLFLVATALAVRVGRSLETGNHQRVGGAPVAAIAGASGGT